MEELKSGDLIRFVENYGDAPEFMISKGTTAVVLPTKKEYPGKVFILLMSGREIWVDKKAVIAGA